MSFVTAVLWIYIFFPSSPTQLTVQCKIDYMFRSVQAIIRPITLIVQRKNKIAIRSEISHLLAVLFFCVLVIGLMMVFHTETCNIFYLVL